MSYYISNLYRGIYDFQNRRLEFNMSSKSHIIITHPLLLSSILFLQIYGPRLFGSSILDFVVLASVLSIVLSITVSSGISEWLGNSYRFLILLYIIITYSLAVTLFNNHQEFFYPLKFFRSLINFIGVCGLYKLYESKYHEKTPYIILEHIFISVTIHGALMLLQYISYDFARILYTITGDTRMKMTRVSGLTISYNTLNLVQGFGFLIGIAYPGRLLLRYKQIFFIISMLIILFSMVLAGRTAMYTILSLSSIALIFKLRSVKITSLLQFATTIFVISIIILSFKNVFISDEVAYRFETYTWRPIYEPIESFIKYGDFSHTHGGATAEEIGENMYFLPDDFTTFFWGSSLSGRGKIYIPSDVGYVLFIFGIGLNGTILVLLLYTYMAFESLKWLRFDIWFTYLALAFTVGVIVIHFKEQSLLTRHAFTISSILLISTSTLRKYTLK